MTETTPIAKKVIREERVIASFPTVKDISSSKSSLFITPPVNHLIRRQCFFKSFDTFDTQRDTFDISLFPFHPSLVKLSL